MRIPVCLSLVLFLALSCAAVRAEDKPLTADSSVDEILDALHDRGQSLRDFKANVKLADTDQGSGDTTTRLGQVIYQKKPEADARLRVTFTQLQQGNTATAKKQEYLIDKGWLVDRDYHKSHETRYQLTRPGEKLDLFQLGKGPFPLPLGQTKESVHEAFDVSKVAPAKDDPGNSVHLLLKPKAGTKLARKFQTIDVWVDMKSRMPVRISTLDANGGTQSTTDLEVTSINGGLNDADFTLPEVDGSWNRHDEPYAD